MLKHSIKRQQDMSSTSINRKTGSQLRLVTEAPETGFGCAPDDPTRRIFEHWLAMFGRNPKRCKLGPTRRAAINAALALYDVDQLELAIEGMAADPLERCPASMAEVMRDVEWLFAKESRIERWCEAGEALRERLALDDQRRQHAQAEPVSTPETRAKDDEAKARLVAYVARMRGGR